ncbi:ATP-binding cassette domain-containing protein [Embleya sp. NPDC050493]|uniref:ATP-binding cassette domain-containing protein n=1 Tax=Embleya sp. NPDC050493 TaxID=3363989 RepID=UPI0037A82259
MEQHTARTAATVHDGRAPGHAGLAGTGAPAIEAHDLVKTYPLKGSPQGVRALAGLSLSVAPGTVFGLLGPNGAGKSTTVKILTTLAAADSGTARVAGHDVARDPARVRRAIGVVAQRSGADPAATARENLILTGHLFGLRGREPGRRADHLLDRFGLAQAGRRPVRTYSGGMQRRLDVALGLVHHPEVLFLDEPTTGLDPEARADMWDEIGSLAGEGLSILLTTHYLDEADRLAARLAIVDHGRVVAEGAPEQLKSGLRGDAVHVDLLDPAGPAVRDALSRVPSIREITVDVRAVHARADNGAAAVPEVLAALDHAGARVGAVTVARPSLDDVYLRHAGRRFDAADTTSTASTADAADAPDGADAGTTAAEKLRTDAAEGQTR